MSAASALSKVFPLRGIFASALGRVRESKAGRRLIVSNCPIGPVVTLRPISTKHRGTGTGGFLRNDHQIQW